MNPLHAVLRRLIFAAATGIWVVSDRRQSAIAQIARMCKAESAPDAPWRLCTYNSLSGLWVDGVDLDRMVAQIRQQAKQQAEAQLTLARDAQRKATTSAAIDEAAAAVAAAQAAVSAAASIEIDFHDCISVVQSLKYLAPPKGKGSTILLMENCEEDMQKRNFRQALEETLHEGKQSRVFVVFLSGTVEIPQQLKAQIRVVEHPLPTKAVIEATIRATCDGYDATPTDISAVLGACGGMTEAQIQSACAEAIVDLAEGEKVTARHIAQSKKEALSAYNLTLHEGDQTYKDVVGLDNAKRKFSALLRADFPADLKRLGLVLLGIPGTGKSFICGAAANEAGWNMVSWNPNDMKGSLQGQTEGAWRAVKAAIEAQGSEGGRVLLLIDEIEKLMASVDSGSAKSDGGVMAGIGGSFLTWLADRKPGLQVFVVGTCNDMEVLNKASSGAFARAGRFRGTLFFDFPTVEQRQAAWKLYRAKHKIPASLAPLASDEGMTPAEISAVCEEFRVYDCKTLEEAAADVPLVAETSAEVIKRLREQASGRYASADYRGKFRVTAGGVYAPAADVPQAAAAPKVTRQKRRPAEGGDLFGGSN